MKIRQKDIAEMAGVSLTTVSLVLNNKPSRISERKKEEILNIAKKYNYFPNYHAKSLATSTSNVIGIIVPNIENPFFASIVKSFEQKLLKQGYVTIIMNSNDDKKNDKKLLEQLNKFNVEGLIVVFSNSLLFDTNDLENTIRGLPYRFVVIDRPTGVLNHNQVLFDDLTGGYLATKHLIELGHKNIGAIMANKSLINSYNRYQGYLKALKEYSIKPDSNFYVETNITFEEGYKNSEKLLTNDKITAIFAVNDLVAFGTMKKATELRIDIPEHISIVGYDNLMFNNYIEPTLTSVQQDVNLMVNNTIKLLFSDITDQQIILKPTLNIGESTSPFKNND